MRFQVFLLMGLCVLFNSGAHIIMKYSTRISGFWARNINPLSNPHIPLLFIIGAVSFAVSIVFYLLVLRAAQLSIAFSVLTSLNYIIIIVYSVLFFRDRLTVMQYCGLILVFAGLFLLLYNYSGEPASVSGAGPHAQEAGKQALP